MHQLSLWPFTNADKNGKAIFTNHTYHINSAMNTTGLPNCRIELPGTLIVRIKSCFQSLLGTREISSNSLQVELQYVVLA